MRALALGAQERELAIKPIGTRCTVSNDCYIMLAHYLKSVHDTSIPENIPSDLLSWEDMKTGTYRSTDELRRILHWAETYAPEKMRKAGYFIMVAPGTLNATNIFLELTASTKLVGILATNEALLALRRQTSQSMYIMLYHKEWEDTFYRAATCHILKLIFARSRSK
jgi:hypothetical protein